MAESAVERSQGTLANILLNECPRIPPAGRDARLAGDPYGVMIAMDAPATTIQALKASPTGAPTFWAGDERGRARQGSQGKNHPAHYALMLRSATHH